MCTSFGIDVCHGVTKTYCQEPVAVVATGHRDYPLLAFCPHVAPTRPTLFSEIGSILRTPQIRQGLGAEGRDMEDLQYVLCALALV